ncbi:MAG: TPP-binding protein [Actinomycetia bacterium]|nr:TPP-binding protein [Actinomycetes bacterium]
MTDPTVAQLVIDGLRRLEIDTLFCLPGVQNDDFFDALVDARDIRPIVTRHEQGAAYMALGAAQATGRPAAFCVVPGPGMLNAGAALSSAYWAGARVLAVIGQIASGQLGKGIGALHELPDQTAILDQLTAHATLVDDPADAVEKIQAALDRLVSADGRPVSLEVPADVWGAPVDGTLEDPVRTVPELDMAATDRLAGLLAEAERPLLCIGGGALDAADDVRALVHRLGVPATARRAGLGVVDSRDPLFVPLPVGQRLWGTADLVVGIGTRMEWPLLGWGLDDDITVAQINIDPDELDRHGIGTVGVLGDAGEVCRALLAALPADAGLDRSTELARLKAEYDDEISVLQPQIDYLTVVHDCLPDDGIMVFDVTQMSFANTLVPDIGNPRTVLETGAAGTLGAAVAQGIGAQAARPDTKVLTLVGDGGFLFTATELATAVQHDIPTTVVLFNDNAYGNVKRIQQTRFGPDRTIASDLQNPDFVALARSFGLHAERVDSPETLRPALAEALAHNGPSLVEVSVGEMPNPWPWLRAPASR